MASLDFLLFFNCFVVFFFLCELDFSSVPSFSLTFGVDFSPFILFGFFDFNCWVVFEASFSDEDFALRFFFDDLVAAATSIPSTELVVAQWQDLALE